MAFEDLRARLDQLLAETRRFTDPRSAATGLRGALVETRVALATMRDAIAATSRELEAERRQLADAERRGRLAAEVGDAETVAVAERFVGRHTERVTVLERRLAVQQDELALAERDYAELSDSYRAASLGVPPGAGGRGPLEEPAGPDAAAEQELDALRRQASREQMDAAVQAQLAALKSKLGKAP